MARMSTNRSMSIVCMLLRGRLSKSSSSITRYSPLANSKPRTTSPYSTSSSW